LLVSGIMALSAILGVKDGTAPLRSG